MTLNHIYPDYDFSLLRAHHFKKEEGLAQVEEVVETHLVEVAKVGEEGDPKNRKREGVLI